MPADEVGDGYDLALLSAAAEAVADSPEEAHELLAFAKPTSMMSQDEQLIMFAKVLRDDKRAQEAHTVELKRTNDLYQASQQRTIWLIKHTASCITAWFSAMQQPKLFIPTIAVVAFVSLFMLGQGDRAMDIAESLIEKYAGVDIHGHADKTKEIE